MGQGVNQYIPGMHWAIFFSPVIPIQLQFVHRDCNLRYELHQPLASPLSNLKPGVSLFGLCFTLCMGFRSGHLQVLIQCPATAQLGGTDSSVNRVETVKIKTKKEERKEKRNGCDNQICNFCLRKLSSKPLPSPGFSTHSLKEKGGMNG